MRTKLIIVLTFLFSAALIVAACGGDEATATPAPAVSQPGSSGGVTGAARMLQKGDKAQPPQGAIDKSKTYIAHFKTEAGNFDIELYDDKAPLTVENFVNLARIGFYDNVTFHRVIADFMAQGGDPTGTGGGGPGYRFKDEFDSSLTFNGPGILAMANSGPATNGSQFFITFAPTPHLNNAHTIFGKVTVGMENVSKIKLRDPGTAATPGHKILTIEIEEK